MQSLKTVHFKKIGSLIFLSLFTASTMAQTLAIIPKPSEMNLSNGSYELSSETSLAFDQSNKELAHIAGLFADHLSKYYHLDLAETGTKGSISLKLVPSLNLGDEAYLLKVNQDGVLITASGPKGVFYGVQTLKQMLPVANSGKLLVPFAEIKDQPRFGWRGLMLDVGRHFFPVSYIKEFLDNMAMYKLNTFHWHLVEDQGWRIEIKQYPRLTEMAHWRDETIVGHARESKTYDGVGYGGFYTQDQIRHIVQYAAERYITVVPEIEMPGHSCAALAAYPELGCTGGPYEVKKTWGVMKDVYCAGQEETFGFLQNVLDEVCELFPSTYIHVGGDECPKDAWKKCPKCQQRITDEGLKDEHELQSYFIQRTEKYLHSKNRKLIGWDEILEGGLAPEATVMSWRGEKGGIEAAKQLHDVVMSPQTYCYFDYYQSENKEAEPLAIGGFLPLETVYGYEPLPAELTEQEAKHILGAQANLWTEYIATIDKLEYMAYPRVCALAEVAWSPKSAKDYADFRKRLDTEFSRLRMYGINYCDHP
jgi:hexosaminidase